MVDALYAPSPADRLVAARALPPRVIAKRQKRAGRNWPSNSPGSLNAWLVLVTSKAPAWRDPLVEWGELPPTLGQAHQGFFYPDPLGFWTEIRHWATTLVGLDLADSLSLTTLLHGELPSWAFDLMQPRVILFLDEHAVPADVEPGERHAIPDPYRPDTTYDGWWRVEPAGDGSGGGAGRVIGKAPQHPATHRLYDRAQMDRFLRVGAELARG